MKPATINYAIYMLLSALGVIAAGIYVQNWIIAVGGLVLILFAIAFFMVERRSQKGRD